eukprot:TRINITY_DN5993_c0_g3_i2.p1 TRINITY_DN5993_c0_g3~~TRINITY_DN5993_c0_g3_i2.p1  ORF type:complete len:292 (+),score=103.47 TRINITY_DN5993_c0_g3_i2:123-998(+)
MEIEKVLLGGFSGVVATSIVQPFDLIKTRMQLNGELGATKEYESVLQAIKKIYKNEGFLAFYSGLSAAVLRQITYTTTRLSVYSYTINLLTNSNAFESTLFHQTIASSLAGALGALAGNPAEIALVRMTADGRLPLEQKRGYRNVFHAMYRICVDEGLTVLYCGSVPSINRAIAINISQLTGYVQIKHFLATQGFENFPLHFTSSLLAGLLATTVSLPFDISKTRLQAMDAKTNKPLYTGLYDAMFKIGKSEGFFSLWKGFVPYFLRIGPHTILTFIILEQLLNLFNLREF